MYLEETLNLLQIIIRLGQHDLFKVLSTASNLTDKDVYDNFSTNNNSAT